MNDLRDQLDDLLVQYAIRTESPIIQSTATDRVIDAVIAAVRDAMLSDEVVDMASPVIFFLDDGISQKQARNNARAVIIDAMDAAGLGGER